jgi:hypothetical protein
MILCGVLQEVDATIEEVNSPDVNLVVVLRRLLCIRFHHFADEGGTCWPQYERRRTRLLNFKTGRPVQSQLLISTSILDTYISPSATSQE